ncbi:hypothetical protein V757_03790 [Pelistega indica]|uniref:PhnO n=1 Tax=Pelistega indica TaxID=1414851 RepID=V8G8X1_9BURK|nr:MULTISPECIES: DUF3579 domain-containing protein [Pelistega]ETD72536.1 hypothetical protein V757_03790 [Pelistega indica]
MQQLIIIGLTKKGQKFRPSDWAERLAGVMAQFRPPGLQQSHIAYSPYVIPSDFNGNKCLIVDERLRQLEPRAWKFVNDFAVDNDLTIELKGEPEFD